MPETRLHQFGGKLIAAFRPLTSAYSYVTGRGNFSFARLLHRTWPVLWVLRVGIALATAETLRGPELLWLLIIPPAVLLAGLIHRVDRNDLNTVERAHHQARETGTMPILVLFVYRRQLTQITASTLVGVLMLLQSISDPFGILLGVGWFARAASAAALWHDVPGGKSLADRTRELATRSRRTTMRAPVPAGV